jgi:hypothetical protein
VDAQAGGAFLAIDENGGGHEPLAHNAAAMQQG